MQKLANSPNSPKIIDLTQKSSEEVLLYLNAILEARKELRKKGKNLVVSKKKSTEKIFTL